MKPEYKVKLISEIKDIPWNGFNVVSTFSGGGGSSTGYRMAGFRVLWASEFIDEARATYNANKAEYTICDGRDIRDVSGSDILSAINLKVGELDLLDGSPPCSSFSSAGKREKGWGKVKKYSDKAQRTDDLFFEFTRLLREIKPKTFVAENVSGLVKGKAKGYFIEIMKELKSCGYNVKCKVLDAQWLGVPQARQRTIFIGVRSDLNIEPTHPLPLKYRYSLKDALPWIISEKKSGKPNNWCSSNSPCSTVVASGHSISETAYFSGGAYVEAETNISKYAIGAEWDNIKQGEKSKKYLSLTKPDINKPSPYVTASAGSPSCAGVVHPTEKRKFSINELKRVCGFPDDYIFTGTFQQKWERMGRAVPPVMMMYIAKTVRDEVLKKC